METYLELLDACVMTILHMSAHAALLVCLVLLIQTLLRKQLSARWRSMLWLLVIARLVVPIVPESPTSVLNLVTMFRASSEAADPHSEVAVGEHLQTIPSVESKQPLIVPTPIAVDPPDQSTVPFADPQAKISHKVSRAASQHEQARASALTTPTYWSVMTLVWLAGAMGLLLRTTVAWRRLAREVRRMVPVADRRVLDLLAGCAAELGLRSPVVMLQADCDMSPAVVGWWRPKLLMPDSIIHSFSDHQLRYIVLHELAHVRRRDVPMLWLVHLMRIVHWFNPLIWLMGWRMTLDRELACDEVVLRNTSQSDAVSYGETILQLVQRPNMSRLAVPAISMTMGGRVAVGQRIARIANYRTPGWRHAAVGVVSLVLLALVGLTSAVTAEAEVEDKKPKQKNEENVKKTSPAKSLDFGQNFKNPFGKPANRTAPKLTSVQKWNQRALIRVSQMVRQVLASGRPTARNPRPPENHVLEGMLGELHRIQYFGQADREPEEGMANRGYDFLAALVRQDWHRQKDETSRAMFDRIKSSPAVADSSFRTRINNFSQGYKRRSGDTTPPWPYDWREKEDFWISLLETIEEAKRSEQPAEIFRGHLPDDPDAATLYRLAYLRVARSVPGGAFDLELVRPLLKTDSQQVLIGRIYDIITAMPTGPEEERTPDFLTMQSRLAKLLVELRDDTSLAIFLSPFCRANPTILYLLEDWILSSASADAGARLAGLMTSSPKVVREWLLGRRIEVKFDQTPLCDVMRHLREEVRFPLWIDKVVLADKTPVTLTTSGTWLDVVDRVLVKSPYRASLLWSRVLWIGRTEDRRQAESLISRVPFGHQNMTMTLLKSSSAQFVETPFQDVAEYLDDLHGVPIFMVSESDHPINIKSTSPFLVLLTDVTRQAGYDWIATDEVIVVGKPEQIAAFQQDEDQRFRKLLFRHGRISQTLESPTSFEFIKTPLRDVNFYLKDLHEIPFITLGNAKLPITANLKGMSLSAAMSLLSARHGISWNCDDDVIVLGPADRVDAYMKRSLKRNVRLKGLPPAVAKQFRKPRSFELIEYPLAEVANEIFKATSIPTKVAPGLKGTFVTFGYFLLPLDVHLDLLANVDGIAWEFKDGAILISKP